MGTLSNPLSGSAVDEYVNYIVSRLEAGDNAATLESNLRDFDSLAANEAVKERLSQAIEGLKISRAITSGGVTTTITDAGTGYSAGDPVTLTGGDGSGATAEVATTADGVIATTTVTAGGSGYTTAGVDATATGDGNAQLTATLTADAVTSLTVVDGGSGYAASDALVITGDGSGATAEVATVENGVITSLTVTGGEGYTSAPTADLTGEGNGDATASCAVLNDLKVLEDAEAAIAAA